jgi:hypothetical protein
VLPQTALQILVVAVVVIMGMHQPQQAEQAVLVLP